MSINLDINKLLSFCLTQQNATSIQFSLYKFCMRHLFAKAEREREPLDAQAQSRHLQRKCVEALKCKQYTNRQINANAADLSYSCARSLNASFPLSVYHYFYYDYHYSFLQLLFFFSFYVSYLHISTICCSKSFVSLFISANNRNSFDEQWLIIAANKRTIIQTNRQTQSLQIKLKETEKSL